MFIVFVQSEDIRFDPIMIVSCIADIAKLCADTSYGQAKVMCSLCFLLFSAVT